MKFKIKKDTPDGNIWIFPEGQIGYNCITIFKPQPNNKYTQADAERLVRYIEKMDEVMGRIEGLALNISPLGFHSTEDLYNYIQNGPDEPDNRQSLFRQVDECFDNMKNAIDDLRGELKK